MTVVNALHEARNDPRIARSEYIVWTRMQAEAGQPLDDIIRRKEMERKAGSGRFFWGVGNAPSTLINSHARLATPVKAIFSKMKSPPKSADSDPTTTVLWRRYIGSDGVVRTLPPYTLVTSRGESKNRKKHTHYALECYSDVPLRLDDLREPFNPTEFRNAGGTGAPVGASQVTSLLVRTNVQENVLGNTYYINMRATLTGGYWVKLIDPLPLSTPIQQLIYSKNFSQNDLISLKDLLNDTYDHAKNNETELPF